MPRNRVSAMPYRRTRSRTYNRPLSSKQARAVRTLIKNSKETFHTSRVYEDHSLGAAGTIVHLSNIAQGDGDNERTGDQVSLQKIYGQLVFKMAASLTGTNNYNKIMPSFRILVLQSKINTPTTADFPSTVYAPVDIDKFYVLQDRLISMKSPFLLDDGTNKFLLGGPTKYELKMKVFKKNYLQFDGTTQQPIKNEIFMYILPDENDSGTGVLPISMSGFMQTYYKDL